MSEPILSILIPAVPSRFSAVRLLFGMIHLQCARATRDDVEILCLLDNKMRKAGGKRQALLDIAKGKYVCFVDDDDHVSSNYIHRITAAIDGSVNRIGGPPDCIVFDSTCSIEGGPPVIIKHDFKNLNEQYRIGGFKRGLWHIHPIRREIAQFFRFPDTNNAEDWAWLKQVIPCVDTQVLIEGAPLYHYVFNSKTTEASNGDE